MLERRSCAHHPDRAGHAVCMACRKVLCQECATTWDGINYCMSCLARRRLAARGRARPFGWVLLLAAILILFYLQARLMVWSGAVGARFL